MTRRAIVAAVMTGACCASGGFAQTDRIIDTPTGWIYGYGAAPSGIDTNIGSGWRPMAIERVGTDAYDYIAVANSGDFGVPGFSTAHTYWAVTPATLAASLSGERILDLDCFELNDTTYMSAVTIPNSGAEGAAWGWLYDQTSASAIINWAENASPAIRLIDIEKYTINGQERWAGVAVNNSGNQSQGWWWGLHQTAAQVTALLTQHSARLIDIELQDAPTVGSEARFAVLMVSDNPGGGWWHPGLTSAQVADMHNQNGARLTCIERYTDAVGGTKFAVAMVDNANAQTRRVRQLFDNALDNGSYGFMLKQVGGPTLAGLNENFAFEPASMLKILHGAYAIDRCAAGTDGLANDVWINDKCNNDECPDTTSDCSAGFEDLDDAIREMLQQSDNNRTMEIELRYGRATLNAYADSLGLTNTQINHRLGCLCGNPFNSFSCVDATSLYEKIADGTLFDSDWRETLFGLMGNLDAWGYGSYPTLNNVINQEAAATSLTAAEISAFKSAVRMANKGGGYSCGGTYYRTDGAWASIPFKVSLGQLGYFTLAREYTIAAFVHGNTSSTDSQIAYSTKEEILREQIRAALQSWDNACDTPSVTNQPDALTRNEGQSATFSITVNGTIGGRQWQKSPNGLNGWVNVTGDTSVVQSDSTAAVTFTNLTESDEGYYRCVISSGCGNATSLAARLIVNPACPADFNHTGSVTVQDIFDFLGAYFAGSASADVNNSGGVTVQDIFDFLAHYFAGC